MPGVVGRLAPSPTGLLHVGNARSLLLAWLAARHANGRIHLRIEDLLPDGDAHLPALLADLRWLGLEWDPWQGHDFLKQSQRGSMYDALLADLLARGDVYPCVCTRKDIDLAARAPHAEDKAAAYPGTCRGRFASETEALAFERERAHLENRPPLGVALRLKVPDAPVAFVDRLHGAQTLVLPEDSGDIVVRRKDGGVAYMFAVVVDDWAMGVTQVVRGDDLLEVTAQQIAVYRALQRLDSALLPAFLALPAYAHVPLVLGDDGRRLAKRNQSLQIGHLRGLHEAPDRLLAWLATSIGLEPTRDLAVMARHFDWQRLPHEPVRFGAVELANL
jgi:glutamyl-tRNA synthetase